MWYFSVGEPTARAGSVGGVAGPSRSGAVGQDVATDVGVGHAHSRLRRPRLERRTGWVSLSILHLGLFFINFEYVEQNEKILCTFVGLASASVWAIYLVSDHIPRTRLYTSYLVIYLICGHITRVRLYTSYMVIYLLSDHIPRIWSFASYLAIYHTSCRRLGIR